jgi:hypothetical protein
MSIAKLGICMHPRGIAIMQMKQYDDIYTKKAKAQMVLFTSIILVQIPVWGILKQTQRSYKC